MYKIYEALCFFRAMHVHVSDLTDINTFYRDVIPKLRLIMSCVTYADWHAIFPWEKG